MKRAGVLSLAIVLALGLAAASQAGGKKVKSRTSATIAGYVAEKPAVIWSGEVSSRKERCERRRTVNVFRLGAEGEDLLGTAVTDRQGRWEFTRTGEFVAVTEHRADVERHVIKKKHGKRLICKVGSSPEEIPSEIE